MKVLMKMLILSSFIILSFPAEAKSNKKVTLKTKNHQCAVYKKNAKKAKYLYSSNKKQIKKLDHQLKILVKDEKRIPANVKTIKKVVKLKINKLKVDKKLKTAKTLEYLEKHIQYSKAAKRTCASHQWRRHKKRSNLLIAHLP